MRRLLGERTVGRVNSLSQNSNDPNSFLASLTEGRRTVSVKYQTFLSTFIKIIYQLKYLFLKSFSTRISILNKEGNEGRNIAYENLN